MTFSQLNAQKILSQVITVSTLLVVSILRTASTVGVAGVTQISILRFLVVYRAGRIEGVNGEQMVRLVVVY